MKNKFINFRKKALSIALVLVGIGLFSFAAYKQLSVIESNKQVQTHCAVEDYFAMYYHYRGTVSQLLFANSIDEVAKYSSQLQALQQNMLHFEDNIAHLELTAVDKHSLLEAIQAKQMYVVQTAKIIEQAQQNCGVRLYSKETKLGFIILTFIILFSVNQSRRTKVFIRRRYLALTHRGNLFHKFAH